MLKLSSSAQDALKFTWPRSSAASIESAARFSASEIDWFERGCELEEQGNLAGAIAAYRRSLALSPDCAETHFNLANALRTCGQIDAAQAHYLASLRVDPFFAEAWYNLGDLHDSMGKLHDAARCLRRAVQIDPLYADAHFNLADCCERLNQHAEAVRHWLWYLKLDPHSEWANEARQAIARCTAQAKV